MPSGAIILIVMGIIMLAAAVVGAIVHSANVSSQRSKIDNITLGMPQQQMLSIMGSGYNRSLLKNNRTKYEWRFSYAHNTGTSYRGISSRTYSGVRKVAIYCKDGYVEEVKPYNV